MSNVNSLPFNVILRKPDPDERVKPLFPSLTWYLKYWIYIYLISKNRSIFPKDPHLFVPSYSTSIHTRCLREEWNMLVEDGEYRRRRKALSGNKGERGINEFLKGGKKIVRKNNTEEVLFFFQFCPLSILSSNRKGIFSVLSGWPGWLNEVKTEDRNSHSGTTSVLETFLFVFPFRPCLSCSKCEGERRGNCSITY